MLPATLYHASAYRHSELMPGYKRSGKLVRWDNVETNEWLYASTELETVKALGLASAIEKKYQLDRFLFNGNTLTLHFPVHTSVSLNQIKKLDVWVYTIATQEEDGWIENKNPVNSLDTEWKTQATISSIIHVEKLNVEAWLKDKHLEIRNTHPAFLSW